MMDPNIQQQPTQNIPPIVTPEPPPEPPKTFGWIKWFLIAAVIALILSGTTYFAMNRTQNQKPAQTAQIAPTTTPDPTANWKMYEDTLGGYTIKYPQDWILEDYYKRYPNNQVRMKSHIIFENKAIVGDAPGNPVDHVWGTIQSGNIEYRQSTGGDGLTDGIPSEADFYNPNSTVWLKGNAGGGGPGYTYETLREVAVAGKKAMMQQSHPSKSYEWVSPDQITINYYIPIDNSLKEIIYISFLYDMNNPDRESLLSAFNQILQTLKFTNATDETASWNIYTSNKFNFTIKYPNKINAYNENWQYEELGEQIGFGPPSSKPGGWMWGVFVYTDKTVEQLIKDTGSQFNDRQEERKNITVNGKSALLVTVTTKSSEGWISKKVFLENNGKVYEIGNGARDHSEFDQFYNSFKLTN